MTLGGLNSEGLSKHFSSRETYIKSYEIHRAIPELPAWSWTAHFNTVRLGEKWFQTKTPEDYDIIYCDSRILGTGATNEKYLIHIVI